MLARGTAGVRLTAAMPAGRGRTQASASGPARVGSSTGGLPSATAGPPGGVFSEANQANLCAMRTQNSEVPKRQVEVPREPEPLQGRSRRRGGPDAATPTQAGGGSGASICRLQAGTAPWQRPGQTTHTSRQLERRREEGGRLAVPAGGWHRPQGWSLHLAPALRPQPASQPAHWPSRPPPAPAARGSPPAAGPAQREPRQTCPPRARCIWGGQGEGRVRHGALSQGPAPPAQRHTHR